MNKTLTYEIAVKELEAIVIALQSGEINMDNLAEQSKRAVELLTFCKTQLRSIEQEVNDKLEL